MDIQNILISAGKQWRMLVTAPNYEFLEMYQFVNTFLTIDLGGLYGCDWHYVGLGLGYVSTVQAIGLAYLMRMETLIKVAEWLKSLKILNQRALDRIQLTAITKFLIQEARV